MTKKVKLLAVASEGGHLVQLCRLEKLFNLHETTLLTTNEYFVAPDCFLSQHICLDINQNSGFYDKFKSIVLTTYLLFKIKPDVVISTGALPGLVCIVLAKKIFRKKTIWLDSIANAEELSKSGKVAKRFADIWLTQWPELAEKDGPEYIGSIL